VGKAKHAHGIWDVRNAWADEACPPYNALNTIRMKPIFIVLFLLLLSAQNANGASVCKVADKKFQVFWQQFKNDKNFQRSRVADPLTVREQNANEQPTVIKLSRQQLKANSFGVIDNKRAKELAGTEGELCESAPIFSPKKVEIVQYSCSTDVYSKAFIFIDQRGCWYLESVTDSGG
jgi:hypothetical protein